MSLIKSLSLMSLSQVPSMENTAPKLPLEIVGKILQNFDDDEDRLEMFKKCRLISPSWYEAVQDSFRDENFHKFFAHFDGTRQTIESAKTFGFNVFGENNLNFSTLRISNCEENLLKTMLESLIVSNLQTLELKDNQLSWRQVIMVLKKFSKIVKFKFIESPQGKEGEKVVQSSPKMYEILQEDFQLHGLLGFKSEIQAEIGKNEGFLAQLVSFEVDIIHILVLNAMSMIISCSDCQLENLSLKFNLEGASSFSTIQSTMFAFKQFEKYTNSLKSIDFFADDSNIFGEPFPISFDSEQAVDQHLKRLKMSQFVLNLIIGYQENFKNLENLTINALIDDINPYLAEFIESHQKLTNFNINSVGVELREDEKDLEFDDEALFSDLLRQFKDEEDIIRQFAKYLNRLMIPAGKTKFGYTSNYNGFRPIEKFSENVTSLTLPHHEYNNNSFSHENCPIFPNCSELTIIFTDYNPADHPDISINQISSKCQNLEKLIIVPCVIFDNFAIHLITNEDLQLIIGQYENLKVLQLENCFKDLSDSGITGLSQNSIQIRSENPTVDLPIEPQDLTGLPISHLKKLECLTIKSETPLSQISDLSAKYGFEGMKNLKKLQLVNTNITRDGFDILKDKTGSKELIIF